MSKKCRSCGEFFDCIATHWRRGDCTGPELSSYQKELVEGMLLGDGFLADHNKEPRLRVGMSNKTFIQWLMKEFGYICTGSVSIDDTERNTGVEGSKYKKIYEIRTYTLASLRKYKDWLDDIWTEGGEPLKMTPLKLKLWYVSNGAIKDRRSSAQLYENQVKSENQLKNVFDSIDIEFTRSKNNDSLNQIRFSRSESQKFWDYIGDSLPGFEYKWPDGPAYSEVVDKHTEEI